GDGEIADRLTQGGGGLLDDLLQVGGQSEVQPGVILGGGRHADLTRGRRNEPAAFYRTVRQIATPTASLLPRQLVGGAGEAVDLGGAVERRVLGAYERQRRRGQDAQRLGDVEHAQDTQEVRTVLVRLRRVDDDDFLDRWLKQRGVGGEDTWLTAPNKSPCDFAFAVRHKGASYASDVA